MKVVTTEQMRAMERQAVDAGISEDTLMESAGLATARRIGQLFDTLRGRRVVVLVGPGNNGGDGMVAARYLADWGALVTLYMATARRRDDKFEDCQARRVRVVEAEDDHDQWQLGSYVSLAEVVVDAMLGIGTDRPLEGPIRDAVASIQKFGTNHRDIHLVAVDVPSGMNSDTGETDGVCFPATLTLTLGAPKTGLFRFPGAAFTGEVETLPIGLPDGAGAQVDMELADRDSIAGVLPRRPRDGHKGSFGSVLLVAGSRRFAGAPVLAASAAYRAGAGIVTLATAEPVYLLAAPRLLEQVHLPLPASAEGGISAASAGAVANAMNRAAATVIGPGLGDTEETRRLVQALLLSADEEGPPIVVDADALNALAGLEGWHASLKSHAVLTPHPGEMARLLGRSTEQVQHDRVGAARESSDAWGQTLVLKGAYTVVASPGERTTLIPFANPLLGTAGTGDVLAGIIGALLARGMTPHDAAVAGAYVHGAAAERLRPELGASGMLASDLLIEIPRVIRDISV